MKKYKFPQFNLEIIDPVITVTFAGFSLLDRKTTASCLLVDGSGSSFGVEVEDLSQPVAWTVQDVNVWANIQLDKYLVP